MTLVQVTSKRRGAPKETVRIYKSGTARLSEDLVIAKAFDIWVDVAECVMVLYPSDKSRPLRTAFRTERRLIWYGNRHARSAFIAIQTALEQLHCVPEKAQGLYRATIVNGCVVIQLKRKLREVA